MHDRAGGHPGLPTAISALVGEGFGLQQPGPAAAATRTDKPFRPPALEKVHRTRAFRRKAVLKFDQRPRKPSLRSRHHPTPRSSRYRGAAYSLVLVLYTKSRSTGRSCIGRLMRIILANLHHNFGGKYEILNGSWSAYKENCNANSKQNVEQFSAVLKNLHSKLANAAAEAQQA